MFAALLTTLLFPSPRFAATAAATQLGGVEANFWRICAAIFFLALWANLFGSGHGGRGVPVFSS